MMLPTEHRETYLSYQFPEFSLRWLAVTQHIRAMQHFGI